jgi:peptidoglycan L-alanyl-D-glutamate endopeptidase CwlK
MAFHFGKASLAVLDGVPLDLRRVCNRALTISPVDFGAGEGLRSDAEQMRDWLRRTTRFNGIPVGVTVNGIRGTGRGNHQAHADGLSHAVDLVPYIGGVILWSLPEAQHWPNIYLMADAVRLAADIEGVKLRWGGVWDRHVDQLAPGATGLMNEVAAYARRHRGPDLLDGPHFELAA